MSTNNDVYPRDFYGLVASMPGYRKESYVKLGMRHFNISEKTAEKRLNNEIEEGRLFEIEDPDDARLRRILPREPMERQSASPIGIAPVYGELAKNIFCNDLDSKDYRVRLNVYVVRLHLVHFAIKLLDQATAESNGRIKYASERNKLQNILIKIHNMIKADPDYDKVQRLVTIEVYPPNPYPLKSYLKPPENPYRNAVCLIQTKHFIMHKLPAAPQKGPKSAQVQKL
ncbi:hypothetical protein [Nitrososphaera sp.]|uniref:hypothetical protein n=1 Tax=Nitrososphaera sp. TaxID=1971748 RepID=UPI002EDB0A84